MRAAFRREYRQLLGLPSPPPIVATVGNRFPWQGVWMERFVLRGGRGGPIPLYCLLPPSLNGAAPAVLAIQGHGPGKDDVVGRSTQDRAQTGGLAEDGNDYGLQLAQRG